MSTYRGHVAWGTLGVAGATGLWFAGFWWGAILMFVSIALAFVMWNRLGPTGSWVALVTLGALMTGVNSYEAVTGSRCPADGQKVFLKANKPPAGCDEMRAGAGSMAAFFLFVTIMGAAAPVYLRRLEAEPTSDEDPAAV